MQKIEKVNAIFQILYKKPANRGVSISDNPIYIAIPPTVLEKSQLY
ncbi:hypothetical protein [Halarsenatibacter silvermanii]|nr:hypothetical protein [Halarsenatibacter silvermanii]